MAGLDRFVFGKSCGYERCTNGKQEKSDDAYGGK